MICSEDYSHHGPMTGASAMPQHNEDLTEEIDDAAEEGLLDGRRVVRCPFTGRRVIATCPDGSTVSSREMYVLLRDGDPVDLVYLHD